MRKFKITESQYGQAIKEGVAVNLPLTPSKQIDKAEVSNIQSKFGNDSDVTLTTKPSALTGGADSTTTIANESTHRIVTKRELQANRLRYLKENSEILALSDFVKMM